MPEVSIITPVYNAEAYIDEFIKMIFSQTFKDFEVIVVNDASPDRSKELIFPYLDMDKRIHYFEHKQNMGQGCARNTGFLNSNGKYIAYIDIDDSFTNDYIEKLLLAIKKDDADIAIANSVWCYEDKNIEKDTFLGNYKNEYMLLKDDEIWGRYFQIFNNDMWLPTEPWGKIIKKSFIMDNSIKHDNGLYEDVITNFNELLLSKKVALISDYIYFYNQKNTNSATMQKKAEYIEKSYHVVEGIYEILRANGLKTNRQYKEYFTLFYFRFIHGVYSFFSKGENFSSYFQKSIVKYKNFFKYTDFYGVKDKKFIAYHLIGFYREMKNLGLEGFYFLFIDNLHEKIPFLIFWLVLCKEYKKAKILLRIYIRYLFA